MVFSGFCGQMRRFGVVNLRQTLLFCWPMIQQKTSPQSPFGSDTQRYWERRYWLFSKFDDGIQTDREGLYSVMPEHAALQIGAKIPLDRGAKILDAFCGIGGSAIGFARAGFHVTSVDIDSARLAMAAHNAGIYGVNGLIEFQSADAVAAIAGGNYDYVFFDPPWGGPDYARRDRFTVAMFAPDLTGVFPQLLKRRQKFAIRLPKNFDLDELKNWDARIHTEWYFFENQPSFSCAFIDY